MIGHTKSAAYQYYGNMNSMYEAPKVDTLIGNIESNTANGYREALEELFPIASCPEDSSRRRPLKSLMPEVMQVIDLIATLLEQKANRRSVILTGSPGSGKTFILQQMAMNADSLPGVVLDNPLIFRTFDSRLFSSMLRSMNDEDADAMISDKLPRVFSMLPHEDQADSTVLELNNYKVAEIISDMAPDSRMIVEMPHSAMNDFITNNPDIIARFDIINLDFYNPNPKSILEELKYVDRHLYFKHYISVLTERQLSDLLDATMFFAISNGEKRDPTDADIRKFQKLDMPIGEYVNVLEMVHVKLDQDHIGQPDDKMLSMYLDSVLNAKFESVSYDEAVGMKAMDSIPGSIKVVQSSDDEIGRMINEVIASEDDSKKKTKRKKTKLPYRSVNTLAERLKNRVIGQDEAIDSLVEAVKVDAAGVSDKTKPIGVFLFSGPSGVGKTELAKQLADQLFTKPVDLIRLDMSEYATEESTSKLFGISPGYIGYDSGGQLTNAVKKSPQSIILLDEVEKAHKNVWNSFLQVFDDGRMTDNTGEVVDFTNTIIIMTSNLGTEAMFKRHTGFGEQSDRTYEAELRSAVDNAINKYFTPELQNRIDAKILFHPLSRDSMKSIIGLQLKKISARLRTSHKMKFDTDLDDDTISWILDMSESRQFGARKLSRVIRKQIVEPMADWLIAHKKAFTSNDILHMTYDGDTKRPVFSVTKKTAHRRRKSING